MIMTSCSKSEGLMNNSEVIVNQTENIKDEMTNNELNTENSDDEDQLITNTAGEIYLYGELHGKKIILEKEFNLWKLYYNEEGMRHLFVEWPYFTAELLNIWMSGDNDDILKDIIISDYEVEHTIEFLKKIKSECPDTIFHGTDVGHSYLSVGIKYRHYLEDNNLEDTEKYKLNEEAIKQGKHFHSTRDDNYRESKMVENFLREFNKLDNQSIMGIYGAAHIRFEDFMIGNKTIVSMGSHLSKIYKERLYTFDLSNEILKTLLDEPISEDEMEVAGRLYQASYFGKIENLSSKYMDYAEYWRLENAYEDFKNSEQTDKIASFSEYPMVLEENQIYVLIVTLTDGSKMTHYTISTEEMKDGMLITRQILIEE